MELFRQYDWMETQFMVIAVCRSLNVRGSIFAPNADGIYCGLRLKSEDLTLRWHDIDVTRGILTMQAACAKTGKPRTIPMNSLVREALQRLPRKSEWVFTKPNGKPYTAVRGFDTVRKAVGLLDVVSNTEKFAVTVHTLRHTFAARLIENGIDLWTVQELGRWSDLKMLEPNILASEMRNLVTAWTKKVGGVTERPNVPVLKTDLDPQEPPKTA